MNVREFRTNLKKHLDEAELGKEVIIERGSAHFRLIHLLDPLSTVLTQKNTDMKFCKHGAAIGFCKYGCVK